MRPALAALFLALALAAGAAWYVRGGATDGGGIVPAGASGAAGLPNTTNGGAARSTAQAPSLPALSSQAAPQPSSGAAAVPSTAIDPSFDVVRIGPGGNAVLAGRAEPGVEVTVRDGGRELGQARADQRGEWVLLPSAPLAPGGRELTLSSRDAAGTERRGDAPVLLLVPGPEASTIASLPDGGGNGGAGASPRIADAGSGAAPGGVAAPGGIAAPGVIPPLALLVPPTGAPRVLQAPAPPATAPADASRPPPGAAGGRLGLDVVDYTDGGEIRFAGTAPPNTPVRVYVDNAPAGDALADAQGRWTMTPREAMAAGVHKLRVDQLTTRGRVQARVELPFQRATLPAGSVPDDRVVVQPGQNLWRLARRAYGSGVRYIVIYQANREQIRDPRLIYPGQTFAVPGL